MRSTCLTLTLALSLAALLAACSSNNDPRPDGPTGREQGVARELGNPDPDGSGVKGDGGIPTGAPNVSAPAAPVKLVFIHHSTGEDWLKASGGDLRTALNQNKYYVTDTNYGWGPADQDAADGTIGDHTDIGHWWNWFLGPHRETYLSALYKNQVLSDSIEPNTLGDPGGENTVVLFKSCFFSGDVMPGNPADPPLASGTNSIYGKDHNEAETHYTVANVKGLYRDLLGYFAAHPERLFILVTTPPSQAADTTPAWATNLRAVNTWLVKHWLETYSQRNVAVLDFSNILTSNGGSTDKNDLSATTGSHHRHRSGAVEHLVGPSNLLAYPTSASDTHPNPAGDQKATAELMPLINAAYNCWKGTGGCPSLMGRP